MIEFYIILSAIFILHLEKSVSGRSLFMACNLRWNLSKDLTRIVLSPVSRYKKAKNNNKKIKQNTLKYKYMYFTALLHGSMNFHGKLTNLKLNAFLDIRKISLHEIIHKVH